MESRIDHEITHHFGKSNAMTRFRNAVKAKMPKAVYDSWYSEIKEAYGDVLVRYLSENLKKSNYTLTDAELQQLMDEYIEEEMLAKLNGGQVPFATEYKAEIEAFRKEIENYNTKNAKSKDTSESKTMNIPAEYSESIDAGGKYDLSEEGGEHNGKRNNGRGISGISEESGDKRGRNTSNKRNVPTEETETLHQISDNQKYRTGVRDKKSGLGSLVRGLESSESLGKSSSDRQETENRRFQQAIDENDVVTANKMLNEKAIASGYIPVKVYRGTQSDKVRTVFDKGNAIWVTPDYKYATKYSSEYSGKETEKSAQLHTEPNSNVYDLYVKHGNVLELGDIEQEINTFDEIEAFAEKTGLTISEVFQCRTEGRKYESNAIWAITNTKRFAELARKKGYDSLHALERNGIETYGILHSENVKSAKLETYDDNGKLIPLSERFDDSNKDIRYDLDDTDSEYMKAVESGETEKAQQMVDETAKSNGYTVKAYHGTSRSDRVGNVFRPDRATSGPMAFFTDNKEIATNYARDKADTSLAYDEEYDSYYTQFRVNRDGKSISIPELWKHLSISEKNKIKELAGQIKFDDDYENIIVDKSAKHGNGAYDAYTLNMHKGNALEALVDTWLDTGDLYRREADFLEVLKLVGIVDAEYRDPDARQEKVYDTWLKIQNPFDTEFADKSFYDSLSNWIDSHDMSVYEKETSNADMWDKNNQTPESWLEKLENDIENGTTHAWTVIPDFVTDYLKEQQFDGIKDKGGKGGGDGHTVWIPFSSEQIKSAEPVTYDDKGNVIPLSERFNKDNNDIRYDIDNGKPELETQKKIEKVAQGITHDELIELAKKNTQEFVDKVKENKSLQKRLSNAKRQMLANPKPTVNVAIAGKVTKDILKEMDSTLKAKDLQEDVISIYTEYAQAIKKSGGVKSKVEEANDTMVKRFTTLAVDIADNAEVFVESEMYDLLKSYVKNTRINVPEHARDEMHYAEFRKLHMGTFNLTNDGLDIDIAYAELCDMFPGMFDKELSSPADQLLAIADTLENLKPYAYNPYSGDMQDAIDHIVYRFVSEADGMTAMPKTKAQKMAEKAKVDKELALDKERENFARKLDREKAKSEKNIKALQKKIDDAKYVRYWEKRLGKEEKAQAVKDVRDKRDKAILKSKIRNIVSDMKKKLDKTEKNGGYPKELVKVAAEVCSALDFHTDRTNKDGTPTKASLKLDALKMQYDALKNSPNYDFQSEHSEEISNKILELHQKVQNKRVVDLTKTELEELKNILSAINHSLSIASKQIGIENAKENLEIATEIINSLKLDKKSIFEIRSQLLKEMKLAKESGKAFIINPHRVFEMIANYDRNSAWWQLYDQILRGSRNVSKFTMDATMPFDELTDGGGNEIAFYDFRTKKVKTGIKYVDGTDVEIPKSIICELVMLWDRKQGRNHLEFGGVKIPDLQLFNKGKTADALAAGKMTNAITQADITRLKGMLDSYDKAWIERSRYLFNKVAKDAINETSMQLVGRELAKADNYIRIYVDSDFVKKDIGKDEGEITIEGHGSLKETTPDAKNPVVLRGLHENVYEHIDFASKYYGLAIPIRNFNKVYRMSINDNGNLDSVKNILGSVFGPRIRDGVVVRAIKDLQSPRHRELSVFNKVKGKWLTATFWANVRSMLKQTTSYWTSSSILDEGSLVKGLVSYAAHRKQTKAEIAKYSGTLYKRSQGLSTTELGDRANRKRLAGLSSKTTKFINENLPALRNIPEWIRPGNWLQSMDVAVSSALWDACKHQVSKTMNTSDEGYMKAVADLYERVIEETQSNYDVLHRPEILKSTNPLNQTLGMFQTDNLQQTGIMYSAFSDLQAKHKAYKSEPSAANEQNLKDAKKRMDKAIRSRIYSSLWMALVIPLGDALLRKFKPYIDDEEKEITSRSFLEQMMLNMCEDMFGVFVPVVGQLGTKALGTFNDGYDFMNDPAFDVLEDFIKATSKIHKAYEEDGDVLKAWTDAIPAISNMTGVPAKNILDLYKAAKGYIGDIKAGEFAHDLEDYTSGNKSFYSYGDLASSICSGDNEKEKKILDYYSANEKEISTASLTKEIKPVYVQMFVDSPEKARELKRKLVLDYDYSSDAFDGWVMDEYLKHIVPDKKHSDGVVSDPEYAAEIKDILKQKGAWSSNFVYKAVKSHYKEVYKDGKEKDVKALRNALLKDGGVPEAQLSAWEKEANIEIDKKKQELEKEKEKYR